MSSPTKSTDDTAAGPTPVGRRSAPALALWAVRVLWLAVAVVGGAGIGDALADHSRAVQLTATSLSWVAWAAVALALVVPSANGLTLARVVVPGAAGVAVAATVDHGISASIAVTLTTTVLAALVVLSGEFGEVMVQASAYGDERRFLLRPPAPFYVPTVVSWLVWCATLVAGPLLLAARSWVAGAVVTAAAVALSAFLPRRFHRLSRRWVVLVPAGLVLHDHVVLAETVMLRRATVRRLGLALEGTQAADLTGPAGGHAIEIVVGESATIVFAGTRRSPNGRAIHASGMLVAPTRPGRLLDGAAAAGLPVG